MSDSRLIGSALVAVGVIIVVIGAGLVLAGYNQQQMAQVWADQKDSQCYAAVAGSLPADASPEDISRAYNDRCGDPYRTNPYAGGELKMLTGLVVALAGGAVAYYGTR